MKNFIKETTEKNIEHIYGELEKLRVNCLLKEGNEELNFKSYRNMIYCLIYTFNNYTYTNKIDKDNEFVKMFVKKLTYEIKTIHELIEIHKNYYERFKCLNDAFIVLTKLFNNMQYVEIKKIFDKSSLVEIKNGLKNSYLK